MKLEKLNDNQIRCTLNKSDLEKRELRLSELAYGSAKARALFRDMIQQASIELGFEAENIPLMIEAIPISNDCLVLVVTKVEDPDELDTRFSRFSSPFDDEEFEDEYSDDFENSLSDSEVYEEPSSFDDDEEEGLHFGEITDKNIRQAADEALDLIAPFTQAIAQAKKEVLKKKQESAKKKRNHQLYAFSDLDTVTRLSAFLTPFYTGESRLYKDAASHTYYLFLLRSECEPDLFRRACVIASDYGKAVSSSYSTLSYFEEHFQAVFRENALETLNLLN
ncbi:MAG: adaptor protein MecA [Clostridiales bacterium]|nr:adaptor protein MecA [Clostridiales bacterium]